MAAGGSLDDDKRLDTVRLDVAHPVTAAPDVGHRLVARRLARAGQPEKALAELIRFSRESPMTPRTASALVTLALQTGRTSPILTLLNQGTEETDGVERVGVLRALARLLRRTGQHEAAIETLSMLLAEAAEDRRARLVLNALLEQHQRWEALDASLDKETRLLLKRRYFRAASRTALRRARLWSERLDDAPRAALRFGQAAQYAEQGHDPHSVFLLRMLWLRALVSADAPSRTIDEAAAVTVEAASRVGREARARAFLRELGVAAPAGAAPVPADEVTRIGVPAHLERPAATEGTRPAGETGPRGAVAGALAAAGRSSAVSTEALLRIEARAVAQGAWPELARFYRQTADALPAAERTGWLEKLAELLESELDDPEQAARVWAEVAQLTGAAEAVSEQVRILDGRNDLAGVKQALDAGVGRAQAPAEKARLLVLRAGEARQRGDDAAARADLEAALRVAPGAIEAAAGLAELAVGRGDPGPLKAFERLLASSSRHLPERPELFRRLARLADASKDLRLALSAWGEVLASARGDDEALERSLTLALALKDDARLEPVVRAALEKDPRGARARVAWVELVALLERTARADEALDALRAAVKAEPGHLEVWLALIDRLVARGLDEEAAWAMEQASTAAPDGPRRVSVWRRLARHARERLSDEEKAEKYEERVERVRASQAPAAHAAPGLPGGPLMVPTPRASRPRSPAAPPRTPEDEAESDAFARALGATREPDAARERPIVIPSRLERVLSPMLADVETREAPADEFVDDEDVDDVVDDEGGGLPPLVVPRLKPQLPSGEGARSSLPTRPERAWPDAAADEPRARGRAPETPRAGPPEGPAVVALPRRAGTGASEAVRRGGTGPAPEALTRASAAPDDVDASRSMGRVPAWSEGAAAAGGAARSSDEGAGGALRRDDDEDGAREPSTGRVPAWSEGSGAAGSAWPASRSAGGAPRSAEEGAGGALRRDDGEDARGPSTARVPPRGEAAEASAPDEGARPGGDRRQTDEVPAAPTPELGDPLVPVPPSFGPSPARLLSEERQVLFDRVRSTPLDPDVYRMLAEHFDTANDANRSSLMLELARALEGDPNAAPRAPRLILSATDRAGLRHPLVRTEGGELLALVTPALCRLFPARGKDALTTEEFSLEGGRGARAAADALLVAVRLLGMRAPGVFVSDELGPPFTALQAAPPRLVVSRHAVRKPLPDAELRFYAGRALFTLSPELLALRTLKRDALRVGLEAVGNALRGHATTEARLIRDALTPRSLEKLKAVWPKVSKTLDLAALMEGARHSVNRAGLVVCGGIAPVVESLRAKKALPVEVTELVRFAASERYLQLRNRRLGKKPA